MKSSSPSIRLHPQPSALRPFRLSQSALFAIGSALLLLLSLFAYLSLPETRLWPRLIAFLLLAWWLPGALLAKYISLLSPAAFSPAAAHGMENGVAAHAQRPILLLNFMLDTLGLGFCWMVLWVLVLHWLPGAIALWQLTLLFGAGAAALWTPQLWLDGGSIVPIKTADTASADTASYGMWLGLLLLLVLAIVLRMPGLGYHEFHVDEVVLLSRAGEAIAGGDDAFARHTKGPGEIAVATLILTALGTTTEATARFPFALVSIGAVLALALLGRSILNTSTGMWAGVLLALNGFALGLSRILQYQAAVLLLSILAISAAWRFAQSDELQSKRRALLLLLGFGTFGLIMHYEFIMIVPALLLLLWQGGRKTPLRRLFAPPVLAAIGAAGLLLAAAYLPLLFNPYVSRTQTYLSNRLGDLVSNNLAFFIEMSTFYNATPFFAGLVVLVLLGLYLMWRDLRRTIRNVQPLPLLALWFLPAFLIYNFVMEFPGTHFYLFMPAWSLLAAVPLGQLVRSRTVAPLLRWSVLAVCTLWLLLSANYLRLVFFQQQPQYVIQHEGVRTEGINQIYWAPFPVPQKPRFGFPIQAGWKTLGLLGEWGYLGDIYASNERSNHLRWYMGEMRRVELTELPEYAFITRSLHQLDPAYDEDFLEANYMRSGEVQVLGEQRIEIWKRQPPATAYVTYDSALFAAEFDRTIAALDGRLLPPPLTKLDAIMIADTAGGSGDAITLDGARVHRQPLAADDTLHVTLAWQPERALSKNYKLFVHVADGANRPLAQWDGKPGLNTVQTVELAQGQPMVDHVLIALPDEMPAGRYRVLVGFYDSETGERLGKDAPSVGTIRVP